MVRDRADIKRETARYPDAELNRYINASNRKLHSILVRYGLVRDEAVYTISVDGSASYAMPTDHFKTLKVWYLRCGSPCFLERSTFQSRPHAAESAITGQAEEYHVAKSSGLRTVELWPRPASGTYLLSYVQKLSDLALDSDELVSSLGYDDEFVVLDSAIKCLSKEGSKTTDLERHLAVLTAQIIEDAQSQEEDDSYVIRDVTSAHSTYGNTGYGDFGDDY